jgi:hypothetical protein
MLQYSIDCGGRFDETSTINGGRVESAESPCMKGYAPDGRDQENPLTRQKND